MSILSAIGKQLGLGLLLASICSASLFAQQYDTPSGMLLGIYALPGQQGLKVTNTIQGFSAHGKLMPNDEVVRVTDGEELYETPSLLALEYAKDRIGPFQQAAIEVFRPGQGTIYLWVEFLPIETEPAAYSAESEQPVYEEYPSYQPGSPVASYPGSKNPGPKYYKQSPSQGPKSPQAMSKKPQGPQRMEARIQTEKEKPGASLMFEEARKKFEPYFKNPSKYQHPTKRPDFKPQPKPESRPSHPQPKFEIQYPWQRRPSHSTSQPEKKPSQSSRPQTPSFKFNPGSFFGR
ncbi:Hypothetical protein PBC10988_21150 [Planctomycetales bacterium 10988]|nr:Hypothetical protein PBC10988_21150 [Planctomycetales bacterium 10988]